MEINEFIHNAQFQGFLWGFFACMFSDIALTFMNHFLAKSWAYRDEKKVR